MKKLLPFFFMMSAAGCMMACDDQEVDEGDKDAGIINLTMHVKQVESVSKDANGNYVVEGAVDKGNANLKTLPEEKIIKVTTGKDKETGASTEEEGFRVSDFLMKVLNKTEAELDEELKDQLCEFQSNEDGMISSAKSPERCPALPCSNLKHTYINASTGKVFFDTDSANYNPESGVYGCYTLNMKSDEEAGTDPLTSQKYQASILIETKSK